MIVTSQAAVGESRSVSSGLAAWSQRVGDWIASEHATTLPLDLGLIGALAAAVLTGDVVIWFHMIFVLLVVAALMLPFRQFVSRLIIWVSVMVALMAWAVSSLDTPSEEISELPLLTLVLVLVYLVAQARARFAHAVERARAELEERTRVEHEILQHQLEDAQRRELIGRASAGLAHDLRNVFVAISGCADELANRHAVDSSLPVGINESGTSCVDDLAGAAERGMAIIDDLLWLGRRHDFESRSVEIGVSFRQIGPLLRRMIRPGVVLRIEPPVHETMVRIDHVGLTQILMNLVVNAADAIEQSGHITVSVRQSVSSVPSGVPETTTTIVVADDGAGFDARSLEHAFEPEYTTKDGPHGGYGLATIWRILERCGGSIQIDSAPGQGTTVSVRLKTANVDSVDDITGGKGPTATVFATDILSEPVR